MNSIEQSPYGAHNNEPDLVKTESKGLETVEGKRPSPGRDKNLLKKHFDNDFYYPPMGETSGLQATP
jgi:hypothetical protein